MKNKIIIFAVITVMIISSIPLVTSATVADLTIEGNTVTLIEGNYILKNQVYGIHKLENATDYEEWETLINSSVYFTNTFMFKITENGGSQNLGELKYFTSIVQNGENEGIIYNGYYTTAFRCNLLGASSNWTWTTGEAIIDGQTISGDSVIFENPDGDMIPYDKEKFYIKVNENAVTHKEGLKWLQANTNYNEVNSIPNECDGSTCPATDVNTDNICDDCGMVFAVLRDYPIPDPYLVFTEEYQTRFPYAFIYKGENNVYHMIFSALEPVYFNGAVVVENNDDDFSYLKYTVNGDTWKYDGGFSDGADIVTDTVYPSFNMNDLDGNLAFKQNTDFFPIPLWVEMDSLTQGEMKQMLPNLGGTITILTLCGVGCLALVIGLSLFGKRSLIFRN